ncbi:metallophosphoesterase family protein [Primorskyibacter marinus]|uniref:metallophosphoesterase family protein n=2 Tax=Roseobacteraceae TaxID=2854170 RepID=UPI0013009FF7|nr:metallophosphoesterase [Primorskyibacter marinus]
MRKTAILAAILAPLLVIAAVETQWPAYAAYELTRMGTASETRSAAAPQKVIDAVGDAEGDPLTLLGVGDIANCPEAPGLASAFPVSADLIGLASAFDPATAPAVPTVQLTAQWPNAPILALGDLVYSSGKPVEFSDCFDPLWKDNRARTLPTPGNHEYNTPDAFGYYQYWGERAGPDDLGYYATHHGTWLILSLNSETDASPGSPQALWLNKTLAASPEACVLAFYHRPAYSLKERGGRDNAVALFKQLEQAGASVVLNGHNHFYERTLPLGADGTPDTTNGTVSFTVGTGGDKSRELPTLDTTAKAIFGHLGVLRLELGQHEFQWGFVDAESGETLDAGQAPCNLRPS